MGNQPIRSLVVCSDNNEHFAERFAAESSPVHCTANILEAAVLVRRHEPLFVAIDARTWDDDFCELIKQLTGLGCDVLWVVSPETTDMFTLAPGTRWVWAAPPWLTANPRARWDMIVRLMLEGKSNRAIGRELGISENTVKTHLAKIFALAGFENTGNPRWFLGMKVLREGWFA